MVRAVADNGVAVGAGSDLNAQRNGIIFDDTSFQATRFDPAVGESVAIGKFVGAFNSSTCYAITPDGNQALWSQHDRSQPYKPAQLPHVFRWNAAEYIVQLPIVPGDSEATSFSNHQRHQPRTAHSSWAVAAPAPTAAGRRGLSVPACRPFSSRTRSTTFLVDLLDYPTMDTSSSEQAA